MVNLTSAFYPFVSLNMINVHLIRIFLHIYSKGEYENTVLKNTQLININ